MSSLRIRTVACAHGVLGCCIFWATAAVSAGDSVLPGTSPLTMPQDVVQEQLAQVEAFFQRRIAAAQRTRDEAWQAARDTHEDYAAFAQTRRAALRRMLGLESWSTQVLAVEVNLMASLADRRVERISLTMAEGLTARGLLFTPQGSGKHAAVVVCCDADTWPEQFVGADETGQPAAWLRLLLSRGVIVYVPQSIERVNDHPYCEQVKAAVGQPDTVGKDRRWILYRLGYVVGHTMPGMDVQDVLAAVDFLANRPDVDPQQIGIAGIGQGGMTALYATALDTRISAAAVMDYFSNRDACWQEPVDRRLPGQLLSFGDAEAASLIAPRKLTIVRSSHCTIPEESVRTEGARAQRYWRRLSADDALVVTHVPPERDATEFLVSAQADALHVSDAAPHAAWSTHVVSVQDAASARNKHFEERLAWLRSLVVRSEADRYRRWGLLTSRAADFDRIQADMLADFRQLVGEVQLDGRPLRPRTELALVTDKYSAYRVMLDVTDGVEVYGNLLVPRDVQGRTAAVICQHGLSGRPEMITGLGMTEDTPYHEFGRGLAEQGYVVFAPLILHHHPVEITNRQARQADAVGMMRLALVRAKTERVVDFLQSLPGVDPERIGYYGLSYGGYSAIWLAPLVPRLKAVVVSGHFNDWRSKITADNVATSYLLHPDEDFYNWDILHRFTHVELIALAAPRPMCIEFGERDGITSPAWTAYAWQQVRDIEAHCGRQERVEMARFDGVHEVRGIETIAFLDRHLRPAHR